MATYTYSESFRKLTAMIAGEAVLSRGYTREWAAMAHVVMNRIKHP